MASHTGSEVPGIPAPLGLSSCLQVGDNVGGRLTVQPVRCLVEAPTKSSAAPESEGEPAESPGTKEEAEAQEAGRAAGQVDGEMAAPETRSAQLLGGTAGLGLGCWTRSLTGDPGTAGSTAELLGMGVTYGMWRLAQRWPLGPQHHSGTKDVDTDAPAFSGQAATGSSEPNGAGCFTGSHPRSGAHGAQRAGRASNCSADWGTGSPPPERAPELSSWLGWLHGPSEGTGPWTEPRPKGPVFRYRKGTHTHPCSLLRYTGWQRPLRRCAGPQPLTEHLGLSSRAPHAPISLGSTFVPVGSGGDAGTGVGVNKCEIH